MNISNRPMEKLVKRPHFGTTQKYHPTITQVFLNADLRGSHNALIALAATHKMDLTKLQTNEAVVFINRARTLMKVFVTGNTFSSTRRDYIDLDVVRHIPRAFGANGDFKYDEALRISLTERLAKKRNALVH